MSFYVVARSISRPVWERLWDEPFAGRVLAVFERACNLVTPDGNLVALVLPQVGDGPLNIVVDGKPGDFATVEPGMSAWLEGRRLQVGGMGVALEGAVVWEPRPDWEGLRAHLDAVTDQLPPLQALSLHHAPAGSLLTLISNWCPEPHSGPVEGHSTKASVVHCHCEERSDEAISFAQEIASLPSASLRAGSSAARNDGQKASSLSSASDALLAAVQEATKALQAGWEGDPGQLQAGAAQLAGLGGGLTPAGDDFLCGVMLWVWLTHPTPHRLCRLLLEAAAPRTTTLSAAFLRAAAEGGCNAPWHHLLAALQSGLEADKLSRAVRDVLSHGSTSGADTLAGFLWMGLRAGA